MFKISLRSLAFTQKDQMGYQERRDLLCLFSLAHPFHWLGSFTDPASPVSLLGEWTTLPV
jgi:hypothetical protein